MILTDNSFESLTKRTRLSSITQANYIISTQPDIYLASRTPERTLESIGEVMAETEIIYNGYDNTIDQLLKVDKQTYDLANTTRMELKERNGEFLIDSNSSVEAFNWVSTGSQGKLILKLGHEGVAEGVYETTLLVYDNNNLNGIIWDNLRLRFTDTPYKV